jgi:hypothetical protein
MLIHMTDEIWLLICAFLVEDVQALMRLAQTCRYFST